MTWESRLRLAGLLGAPLVALAVYVAMPDVYVGQSGEPVELGAAGRGTAAVTVWMGIWWMTEAIPLYATALLPIVLFPLLDIMPIHEATAPYAHELIFLFMGGFILALSMQRWGLDRRISLHALRLAGSRPERIVGAFMLVTAGLSMWVSNTATAVMMLPIAMGVIELLGGEHAGVEEQRRFATCLLLGIAYAASIGGVGTLIGTPPNLFLASYASENLGVEIGFLRWMVVGVPIVACFLPITWLLLTRVLHPVGVDRVRGTRTQLTEAYSALGPVARGEWATLFVFAAAALAWITRPWLTGLEIDGLRPLAGLTDPGIAMGAALVLFLFPVDTRGWKFAMDWHTAVRLPWGLLLLFGGGLSLAAAIRAHGLGEYLGHSLGTLSGMPTVVLVLGVVALLIFLTEITSNTATAATLIPIIAGLAPGLGAHPLALTVPAAIAASCAFMLPVATPPNAVVFGSGHVRVADMARAGVCLNLIGILLITGLCQALVLPVLTANLGMD